MVHSPSSVRNTTDVRESEPTDGIELGQTESYPPEQPPIESSRGLLNQHKQLNPREGTFSFSVKEKNGIQHEVQQQRLEVIAEIGQLFDSNQRVDTNELLVSDQSVQGVTRKMWGEHIQVELEEHRQTKIQEKRSAAFYLASAGSTVTKHMSVKSTESPFARLVAIITVVVHVYNYWTCLFFMGIEGFPTGLWYLFEIAAEAYLGLEFIMQFCMPYQFKWLWQDMYLLRDSMFVETMPWNKGIRYLIVALPSSFIISMVISDNPAILHSFGISCFRIMKLLRFSEVKRFFELFDLQSKKERSYSLNRLFYCVFFLGVYLHAWTMLWLNTGRMDWSADASHGWYALAKFNLGASWYEMYMESFYYVISTFSGAGFGNIIPTTNYEWFIATLINLVGTCLFSCIFVDFVMEYLLRDLKEFQNANLFEQIMQFAESTSLPQGLVFKIRYYYKDLNLKFQDFTLKRQIVNEMPESIKGQICIMLNREIIESVKFFQAASPDFITKISILMVPQICLNDDFIVRINEPADKMYFIHSGYVEVLCKNGNDPLVYFGKGDYFGEIGVLLTGTRSVSVKSKSNAVVYYIMKDDLQLLLKSFPEQLTFLQSVAKQRLQTTPYDLTTNESDTATVKTARYSDINQLFEKANVIKLANKPWFSQQIESLKLYIILPLTSMWWFWNLILMSAILINCLMIPYGVGFNQNYGYNPFIIFSQVVYFFDIPVRARTGILSDYQISIDHKEVLKQYMDKWIISDLITFMPFEYALSVSGNQDLVPYVLLLRLLKFGRLVETFEIIRNNSRHSINQYTYFLDIFGLFFLITHWLACLLAFVGRRELTRNSKYDGNCWFKDMASRVFFDVNGDFTSLTYFDQYKAAVYTCTQIMGGAIYGDSIPQTSLEQTIVSLAFVVCNTLRAFLFVKLAAYYQNTQKGQLNKIQRSTNLLQFVKSNNVSKEFLKKIEKFCYQMRHKKDVWEGSECIQHLPLSLQADIKQYLQESQVQPIKARPVFQKKVHSEYQVRPDLTRQYERFLKIKQLMDFIDLLVVNWNIWFIPLQFSFKIQFSGIILVFEIMTIIFYLVITGFQYHRLSWLHNLDCVKEHILKRKDLILLQSNYLQQKESQVIKQKIVIGLIATIPMSWILSSLSLNPYITVLLCSLRLVKLYPLMKFFRQRQKDQLTGWRIISTIYFYYVVTNVFANIMILIGIWDDDWTQNWLRRCPVPTPYGTRLDPYYRADLSPLSIYVHALYYVVSTFSHVAIGDISAVRPNEWVANTCLQWWTWCIYAVLFADITNLVSNTQSKNYKEYSVARADLIKKLKLMPEELRHEATLYVDFQYKVWQGVSEEIVKDLPQQFRVEFLLEKYCKILDQCLLLKVVSTAQTNISLASDLLSIMQTKVFLDMSFILKVGQQTQFMLVLEGNVNVQTLGENLGQLNIGDYFCTRLGNQDRGFSESYFRKVRLDTPPKLELADTDNFENRSVVHLISIKHVTIGYLTDQSLDQLFVKYPELKAQMLHTNRFLFDVGRKAIEQCLLQEKIPITREACVNLIVEHYTKSGSANYSEVQSRYRQQRVEGSISNKIKKYFIKNQQKQYRNKLLKKVCQEVKKEDPPFIVCCEQFIILEDSLINSIITYSTFINRIYITLVLPVQIGFDLSTTGGYLYLELVSHLLSFVAFLLQFRIPVVQEDGTLTLTFSKVWQNYYRNGMVVDILAFLPINLIIPFLITAEDNLLGTICVAPLRIMRIFSATQLSKLFQKIQADFKKNIILEAIGNVFFIFCIGHWSVCCWIFLTQVSEQYFAMNWQIYQKYSLESPVWEIYNHSWYAIANIVAAVGSGDIFGTTDLERMFFVCLMTGADVIFALAFGLIADLTSSQRSDNAEQNFLSSLVMSERIMKEAKFNDNWTGRVQQLMMYKYELKDSCNNLDAQQLIHLPQCLAKEILFVYNRDFMQKLFNATSCENLLRHLAFLTKTKIQMPDDIILQQGEVPLVISQIVLGSCSKLNGRMRVIQTLTAGTIIGDVGRRSGHVIRAETHMLLKQISVQDIAEALKDFPSLSHKNQGYSVSQIVLGSVEASSDSFESEENEDVFEIANVSNPTEVRKRRSTFQGDGSEFRKLIEKSPARRTSVIAERQETLANLVMRQYKKKPTRRLSKVSIGSQLTIQQNSGRQLAIDLI